jgi:hypothetical protein
VSRNYTEENSLVRSKSFQRLLHMATCDKYPKEMENLTQPHMATGYIINIYKIYLTIYVIRNIIIKTLQN